MSLFNIKYNNSRHDTAGGKSAETNLKVRAPSAPAHVTLAFPNAPADC